MNATNAVNLVLWSVQVFLALFFLGAGAPKILGRGMERWTGFSEMPRSQVVFIGITEVLGALGLVLPMATGVLPWLTPLAAVGLAIIVLMAAGFHVRADERLNALETVLWASIAGVIAIGRWNLIPARVELPAGLLVVALGLLVPAAIVNVVILLRRPVRSGRPGPISEAVAAQALRT
jgi:DoxX-like protein